MRQLILSSIKNNQTIANNLKQAFDQAQLFLKELNINLDADYVFFGQTEVSWTYGLEYERHSSFIEFIVQTSQPPERSDTTAIVIKSSIEQYLDQTRRTSFNNSFLFDLYRLGCGTFFAKKFISDWSTPKIKSTVSKQAKLKAKQSLKSQETDDYWFIRSEQQPNDFLIWWFGASIINSIDPLETLSISEEKFLKIAQKYIDSN